MIKIAICDDEKKVCKSILHILENETKVMGEKIEFDIYESGEALLQSIEKNGLGYCAIFLDIILPNMNGIELGKFLKKIDEKIEIIFITNSMDFVLDGYDVGAYNYLVKPINEEKLRNIFAKVVGKNIKVKNDLFTLVKKSTIVNFDISDIMYFEINNRVITIRYKGGAFDFYDKIEDVEKQLEGKNFVRPHRSFLVNLEYIFKIDKTEIVLKDGTSIKISRLKINEMKEKFMEFIYNKK
ncbi:MAG: LytR/AlgR family response regulator transcription factor [Sarcina sp.]